MKLMGAHCYSINDHGCNKYMQINAHESTAKHIIAKHDTPTQRQNTTHQRNANTCSSNAKQRIAQHGKTIANQHNKLLNLVLIWGHVGVNLGSLWLNLVTWWFHGGFMVVSWWFHGGYMVVTWWLHVVSCASLWFHVPTVPPNLPVGPHLGVVLVVGW